MTKTVPQIMEKEIKKPLTTSKYINRIQITCSDRTMKTTMENETSFSSYDALNDSSGDLTDLSPNSSNQCLETNNDLETCILNSTEPIRFSKSRHFMLDDIHALIKSDDMSEKDFGLCEINQDPNPMLIKKQTTKRIEYVQEVAVRYLRPPTPPEPGEIIIQEMAREHMPIPPPIIIRQQPPRLITPEPLVIREKPPTPPKIDTQRRLIRIASSRLPPPPRRVVFERLPQLPSKPQSILIERWLPYQRPKRRVIFYRSLPSTTTRTIERPRNVIVQWDAPQVDVHREYKCLGVIRANPMEYENRYKSSLVSNSKVVGFIREISGGDFLANNSIDTERHQQQKAEEEELVGDVHSLAYVDLEREGLGKYRDYLYRRGILKRKTPSSQKEQKAKKDIGETLISTFNEAEILGLAEKIFLEITDHKLNGRISFNDAEIIFHELKPTMFRKMHRLELKTFFSILDKNKLGSLSLDEFKHAFISLTALYI